MISVSDIERLIRPLRTKLAGLVVRGVVKAVNDAGGVQVLKISALADETKDGVERVQQYGLTSNPKEGSEVLALSLGGSRSHLVVISVDDRSKRPTDLAEGEVALWSDFGDRVWLKDGQIVVGAPDGTKALALAEKVDAELQKIWDLLSGSSVPPWVPFSMDGGLALQTAAIGLTTPGPTAVPQPTGSEKVVTDG